MDQSMGQRQPGLGLIGGELQTGTRRWAGLKNITIFLQPLSFFPPTLYPFQRLSSLPEQDVVNSA